MVKSFARLGEYDEGSDELEKAEVRGYHDTSLGDQPTYMLSYRMELTGYTL